jgi:hypothetical protein
VQLVRDPIDQCEVTRHEALLSRRHRLDLGRGLSLLGRHGLHYFHLDPARVDDCPAVSLKRSSKIGNN